MSLHQLKPSFVITLFAIVIFCIVAIPSQFIFNNPELQQQLTDLTPKGVKGMLFLFFILALLTSIALPRQMAAFICGYSFGFIDGVIIATLAATTGCFITFIVARKCLKNWVMKFWPKKTQKISAFLADKLIYKAIIIRILPIGSNFFTNIVAGACSVPIKPYLFGSFIGFIPQMVIFSLAGAGIKLESNTHIMVSIILFIVAALMSLTLYKIQKTNK